MLPFLLILPLAQTNPIPRPSPTLPPKPALPRQEVLPPFPALPPFPGVPTFEGVPPFEVVKPTEVRALPGQLDAVPVFHSNSPEVVQTPGILLSTFPPGGKRVPEAHLNFPLQGRFDIFAHHITRAKTIEETRTLFQGIIIQNPSPKPVTLYVLQAASYLTSPDALFIDLPDLVDNPAGTIYSGPGSRAMNDVLRGLRQPIFPARQVIPPGQAVMLMNLPIPVGKVVPSSNGRSTLIRLSSSGPVYVASLAMLAPLNADGSERSPALVEWQRLLDNAGLAGPRDRTPTPPDKPSVDIVFGRVAGVARGSEWRSTIADPGAPYLSIPQRGRGFSYALNTVPRITLGTNQVQSAPMLARYPDTAYFGHGNYGVEYSLTLPLYNSTDRPQTISLFLSSPVKDNEAKTGLLFLKPRDRQVFFRGTVRVNYKDDKGLEQTRYVHLVQRRGQLGESLAMLNMPPGDRRTIQVDFLYPPDSTPPQALTIETLPTPITPLPGN